MLQAIAVSDVVRIELVKIPNKYSTPGAKPPRKGCFFEKYEPPEAAPPQQMVRILIKKGHFLIKGLFFYKKGVFFEKSEPPEAAPPQQQKACR